MADVSERLDRIELAVSATNEQLAEVRGELGAVKSDLGAVKSELGAVKDRLDKHDERFDSLEFAVHQLRLLDEYNTGQIKLVAEVQSRHGEKLDELTKAIEPLKDLRDFVKSVADDHERRITELERERA